MANTPFQFSLGYNQTIDTLLEDPNLSYILNNHEVELARDKIYHIYTVIAVWLEGPIP